MSSSLDDAGTLAVYVISVECEDFASPLVVEVPAFSEKAALTRAKMTALHTYRFDSLFEATCTVIEVLEHATWMIANGGNP